MITSEATLKVIKLTKNGKNKLILWAAMVLSALIEGNYSFFECFFRFSY